MNRRGMFGALCALLLLCGGRAHADPQSQASVARANAGTVGVVSGGVDGTYIRIAADLSAVLDDGDRLRVLPIVGKGSLQNLSDILFLKGVDIGIVQGDTLAYARNNHLFPGIDQSIQYVAKLYDEELHILARGDIKSVADLNGKKVNVDLPGAGTGMTASVLFDTLGIKPEFTNFDQDTALVKLRQGEISAMAYVTGKPARLFANIGADSGLHFISVPISDKLLETYLPATLDNAAYPGLIPENAPVDTIAVGSVMAVYAWPPGTERYTKVSRFVDAFFSKFQQFLQPPRHPKWRDVNLAAQVPGWTRFEPAQDWLHHQAMAQAGAGTSQAQFNAFLMQVGGAVSGLAGKQKDALFQQFLDWRNHQQKPQ